MNQPRSTEYILKFKRVQTEIHVLFISNYDIEHNLCICVVITCKLNPFTFLQNCQLPVTLYCRQQQQMCLEQHLGSTQIRGPPSATTNLVHLYNSCRCLFTVTRYCNDIIIFKLLIVSVANCCSRMLQLRLQNPCLFLTN